MSNGIRLIAGLGNPGPSYENTRHNAGAWFVQALAKEAGVSFKSEPRFKGHHVMTRSAESNCELHLLLPSTFMNLSGQSISALARYYAISPAEMLVVHDDIDLPIGDIRLKFNGGHGGHNGLRDIISHLGSADFHRLRIGVNHPGHRDDVSDYVLSSPSKQERAAIFTAFQKALSIVPTLQNGGFHAAMKTLNTKTNNDHD